jgi:hypothetical protein
MIISDYIGEWKNDHDDEACNALKEYDTQCDYSDGTPKPARYTKPLSYYSEKIGRTSKELKEHWRCIENDNQRETRME